MNKGGSTKEVQEGKKGQGNKIVENKCYRCGMKNHWSRTCRTPKHLADLYQESMKNKGKNVVETNFITNDDYGLEDLSQFDVADFLIQPENNVDHIIE